MRALGPTAHGPAAHARSPAAAVAVDVVVRGPARPGQAAPGLNHVLSATMRAAAAAAEYKT